MENISTNSQSTIIFASCKSWHRPLFESLKSKFDLNWIYMPMPSQLDDIVDVATPKYIFFLHWNWLAQKIWEKYEYICFHMTDVPYGHGGSPL